MTSCLLQAEGRVDIINSTLGKALGGAAGGYTTASRQGINFNNSLRAASYGISVLSSFSLVSVWLCIFWRKNISTKAAHKMLMKLTKRLIFSEIIPKS